jgi:Na+-translocating ferredoxin:NAD+ oxidoreductase RNF subunit RnfB
VNVPMMLMAAGLIALLGAATAGLAVSSTRQRHPHAPDLRLQAVLAALPGADCGACGSRSCLATAVGVANGSLPEDACKSGGDKVARAVAEAVGRGTADGRTPATGPGKAC